MELVWNKVRIWKTEDLPVTHYTALPAPFFSEDLLHDLGIFTDVKTIDLIVGSLILSQRASLEMPVHVLDFEPK
jgi:hypothetical protein